MCTDNVVMSQLFESICGNKAHELDAKVEDGKAATPLFVVAGACPSSGFAMTTPMQAIAYFRIRGGLRFWCV
jgi:hypothetical protein